MEACKKPCSDCPFRKNSLAGWLSDYTPQELHSIVVNEMPFPCHLTHKENLSWEEAGKKETPLCAGALMYMRKAGKSPRKTELAKFVKKIKLSDCDNILSVPEFFAHHTMKPIEAEKEVQPRRGFGKRTGEEIQRQIDGLKAMKKELPETTFFGDNNWERIDAQLDIIECLKDADDFYIDETSDEYEEGDNDIYFAAVDAENWLDGEKEDDLFELE